MAARQNSITAKERFWGSHCARQAREGLSVRRYCERHDLAVSTFALWRRRLGLSDAKALGRGEKANGRSAIFSEVRVKTREESGPEQTRNTGRRQDVASSGVELIVSRPLRLVLGPGFDEEAARQALRLAREAGEC